VAVSYQGNVVPFEYRRAAASTLSGIAMTNCSSLRRSDSDRGNLPFNQQGDRRAAASTLSGIAMTLDPSLRAPAAGIAQELDSLKGGAAICPPV